MKSGLKSQLKAQPLSMLNCIKFKFQDNGKLSQRRKINGTQPLESVCLSANIDCI